MNYSPFKRQKIMKKFAFTVIAMMVMITVSSSFAHNNSNIVNSLTEPVDTVAPTDTATAPADTAVKSTPTDSSTPIFNDPTIASTPSYACHRHTALPTTHC